MINIEEVIRVWEDYTDTIDNWETLVADIDPKASGCGPIYEFKENPIRGRPNEDFCIADMRLLEVTEPHYHPKDVTEVYFVINGLGKIVVGEAEPQPVSPGSVVIMPPLTAHYTIPEHDLVIAVVNTPPFTPDSYIPIKETNLDVGFDKARFNQLISD